jgi:hypothetical protein
MRGSCFEHRKVSVWVLHGWINYYFLDITSNPANGQAGLMGRVPSVEKHRSRSQKKPSHSKRTEHGPEWNVKIIWSKFIDQKPHWELAGSTVTFWRCQFRISARQRLPWHGFFCGFLSLLEQIKGQYVKLCRDRFILHPFQFIINSLEVA